MSDFSQPWDDGEGVKGLWPGGKKPRNETVFRQIVDRRTEHLRLCREWREAAEADGWEFQPTYMTEAVERAFRGTREGFVIQGICRSGNERYPAPSASIHIWGPDGLAIKPPLTYDMEAIRRGVRVCGYCGADDVDTVRVGFAGRCCRACEPTVRPRVETPGWNN
jgi:hypothetical protein